MSDELLRRYAPVLLADDGDRFLKGGVVMHAARVERWLQYWLAYPGDRDHAGVDWEMVMVRLGPADEPLEVVYAQHRTAQRRAWARVKREGDRPVVFVGRDKHSSRFRRGWHRNGWHAERANGRSRLDALLVFDVPVAVRSRPAHRAPEAWLARLGV